MCSNTFSSKYLCAICIWQKYTLGVESMMIATCARVLWIRHKKKKKKKWFWFQYPMHIQSAEKKNLSVQYIVQWLIRLCHINTRRCSVVKVTTSFTGAIQVRWVRFFKCLNVHRQTKDCTVLISDNYISLCKYCKLIHGWINRSGLGLELCSCFKEFLCCFVDALVKCFP